MNFEKIRQLDYYIESGSTGSPGDLAAKMGVSKSMLFRYIGYMKTDLKAPIKYQRMSETYVYLEKGKLCLKGWELN